MNLFRKYENLVYYYLYTAILGVIDNGNNG